MRPAFARESGRTTALPWGLAGWRTGELGYIVSRAAVSAVAIAAFVVGVLAWTVTYDSSLEPGVTLDLQGMVVLEVSNSGFAAGQGIQAGQRILQAPSGHGFGAWQLRTVDDAGIVRVATIPLEYARLVEMRPVGLGSLALGGIALLLLRGRRRFVPPVAAAAFLLAGVPLPHSGDAVAAALVLAGGLVIPGAWLAWHLPGPRPLRVAATAATIGLVVLGLAEDLSLSAYPADDAIRPAIAFWGTLAMGVAIVVTPILRREPIRLVRPRLIDTAALAVVLAAGLVLSRGLAAPLIAVPVLFAVAVILLPGLRRATGGGLEAFLLGDVRARAALQAAEEERARMARELHDVPLQHLAAVIRRLDLVPQAGAEADQLRLVASQLRAVATELRPPVLDDLGLAPALDFLAEQTTSASIPVETQVRDRAGLDRRTRPPAEVELAAFRVAQEAVANAIQHAQATSIRIDGEVSPERVELEVRDDGVGFGPGIERGAARRGRFGLASMHRRAEAVDADLHIESGGRGTTIRLVWQA